MSKNQLDEYHKKDRDRKRQKKAEKDIGKEKGMTTSYMQNKL